MQAHQLSRSAARNRPSQPQPVTSPSVAEGIGLAHDAGNLLGALSLYCDLLDAPGVLRPEHAHYVRELRLLSQRSGMLIGRLLHHGVPAISHISETQACPITTLRNLEPLLRLLATPDATLSVHAPASLPPLSFSAETFERVLVNLTRNAARALRESGKTAPEGAIAVTVEAVGPHLRLTVADNGPGMSAENAAAFRQPSPLPSGARRGFGHRIVHELLQSTGGELSIHLAPGYGTTVRIDWPLLAACHSSSTESAVLPC